MSTTAIRTDLPAGMIYNYTLRCARSGSISAPVGSMSGLLPKAVKR